MLVDVAHNVEEVVTRLLEIGELVRKVFLPFLQGCVLLQRERIDLPNRVSDRSAVASRRSCSSRT